MATTTVSSIADLDTTVDCDFHVTEYEEELLPYLEDPYYSLLNTESHSELISKSVFPTAGYLTPMDTGKIKDSVVRSPDDVTAQMTEMGLDTVVLNPTRLLLLSNVHHREVAAAFAHAYNDYLLDTYLDDTTNLYGSLVVAAQKPYTAAEEIDDRAAEDKLVGALLPIGGVQPLLGHEEYYPIYEACENAGLPLLLHNGVTSFMQSFPAKFKGSSRFITAHVGIHPADYIFHLASMLTHGVPERFPDLDIVIQEAGIGWIPYFIRRYENEYAKERQDAPLLRKPPREYIDDQFYFTSQPIEGFDEPEYLISMIRLFNGQENLMFSSDYPHYDFDHSSSLLTALRSGFDADVIQRIYGQTALDVFSID